MLAGLTTSDWLNIGGGAIAVIGFAVTLLQLARVKKALDRHVTRSAGEMLAFSIAQLERFEGDIRHAANDGSSQLLTRAVLDWRGGAADARALLPYALPEDADDDLRLNCRSRWSTRYLESSIRTGKTCHSSSGRWSTRRAPRSSPAARRRPTCPCEGSEARRG